jgi:leukotriene-A4 hydrolase
MLGTVIHEITHSWFGNDVGCQNWNHFWINEGLNVFMERKVIEFLSGEDEAKIDYFTGNASMYSDMEGYGLNNSYSSLFPDIGDDDPENSFSGVPYEKGAQFMYWIEKILGKVSFQQFFRSYILEFHQRAINATSMYVFYKEWVTETFPANATEIITMTQWDTWVYSPGVAPTLNITTFETEALAVAIQLADAYVVPYVDSRTISTPSNYLDYWAYTANQKLAFIQG